MNKVFYLLPLLCIALIGTLYYSHQSKIAEQNTINKPMPDFAFKTISLDDKTESNEKEFSTADFPKDIYILNIFATWCTTCALEHAQLLRLANIYNIPVYGIAFRDKEELVKRVLSRTGNPFRIVLNDDIGYSEGYFNIKALPQTYIVDSHGNIRLHHPGPVKLDRLYEVILPMIEKLKEEENTL